MKFIILFSLLVISSGFAFSDAFAYTISDDSTGGDCSLIGTWSSTSKICTLSDNLTEGIVIGSNGITLDGNGKSITGTYTSLNPSAATFREGVMIDGKTSITIKNILINNVPSAIHLITSDGNTIQDNILSDNGYGMELYDSDNNQINSNTITGDNGYGIWFDRSNGNTVSNNIQSGASYGFITSNSGSGTLTGNSFKSNGNQGIYLGSSVGGYTIQDNIIESNTQNGIQIDGGNVHIIKNNLIKSNGNIGIQLSGSEHQVYNNNFISNNIQIKFIGSSLGTIFDLGSSIGGNYWNNFDESIEGCENVTPFDKYCDTQFIFDGGQDNFPWVLQNGAPPSPPPDTIPPVVVVPNDIAIQATSNNPSPVTFSVSATDDTDGTLSPACTHASGDNFPIGTTAITCTATDAAGNTSSESFTITVTYEEPTPEPVFVTVQSSTSGQYCVGYENRPTQSMSVWLLGPIGHGIHESYYYDNTSAWYGGQHNISPDVLSSPTMNCSSAPLLPGDYKFAALSGSEGTPAENTILAWSTTLTVESIPDTIPPVVVTPNDMAIQATSNNPSPVTFSVSASDNIDGNLSPICSHVSGSNFPIGVTTVTCTATDAAGNTDSESFTITVTYDEPTSLPLNIEFDKLNYQTTETAIITITGTSSDVVSLLIIDPSDKPKGDSISITLAGDGTAEYELDLSGYASGVYSAVVSKGSAHNSEVFTVGLQTGSGEIQINTTKLDYAPGDSILILGDTAKNVLLTITLSDPDGNIIKEKETFSDKNGKISESSFRIPSDAKGGMWSINAKSGANFDTIEVEVIATATEGIQISVEEGEEIPGYGQTLQIIVIGVSQTVDIEIISEDGEVIESLAFQASGEGEINQPWIIPKDAEPGTYTVSARDAFNSDCIKFDLDTFVTDENCTVYQVEPEPEPELEIPAPFVDQTKDPQYYVDRYNNEPAYKDWFDDNYPEYSSIYQAVGLEGPTPDVDPNTPFRLSFDLSGMSIFRVVEDYDFNSLILYVDVSSSEGMLEVSFPRDFFDSTYQNTDDDFVVLSDGNEPRFSETRTTSSSRTLTIYLPQGTEAVEIIGSDINGYVSNNFPIFSSDYKEELEIESLSTRKTQYREGDTIVISGKVQTTDFNTDVTLQVFKDGNLIDISQVSVSSDETFTHAVLAEGPLWNDSGKYTVKATYGSDVEDTSFVFRTDNSDQEPDPDSDLDYEVTIIPANGSGAPGCEETSDGCYIPQIQSVAVGGVVIMKNTDTAAHTYTSGTPDDGPDGIFDTSLLMAGGSYEWSPTEEGVYPYFCMVHPWMLGTILVGEGTSIPPTPEPESEDHIDLEISAENRIYDINTIAVLNISIEDNSKSQNVALDITDPHGTTVVSRSISMAPNDSISFEFKIDENAKTGNYKATVTTSDGKRTEKDSAHFKIKSQYNSFKIDSVSITDQKGNPSDLEVGETGFIKVNISSSKSIATLLTVNIFDAELTSIGIGSVQTTLSSGDSEIILSFNIPDDAAIGPADIYVNAFSDWPSEGGVPLTGEVSIVEDIE
ncbi:MG2 domain protein [Marine Group I thaumarchaeote SCGC RSA3]|uniref:MG2 domain protein n=2 Tax=Marine Group I TaxID=905826 RepID=A0A087RT48_9ARCH|nr:MG2 domain protein [Marine Group I thaumarchaeote SCGC AAA799-D11]KFM18705.1 MG2 domain protein [Marine Group I thaumarchaeote SCGC RSA3]